MGFVQDSKIAVVVSIVQSWSEFLTALAVLWLVILCMVVRSVYLTKVSFF